MTSSPPLKAIEAPWHSEEVRALLAKSPETLTQEELVVLVRELDRRFMQLWHKVAFERDLQLVDYSPLHKEKGT